MTPRLMIPLALAALAAAGPPEVDPLVEEFERSRADVARRLAIIRRLGELKHSAASRALFELAQKHRFHPIECVLELAPAADPQTVRDLVQYAKLQTKTALQDALGLALPTVVDSEAGPWLIEKGLVARDTAVRLACIRALGAWGTAEARDPLRRLAREQLRRRPGRRDADLLYECARALRAIGGEGVPELLDACAADRDWRARLAAAGDALLLDPHPVVRWASIGLATKAAGADLAELAARGGSRTRGLAQAALVRVAGRRHGDWDAWCRIEGLKPRPASGALEPLPHRVLFVADMSARATTPPVDGVRREIAELLRRLPADARVNLVTARGRARLLRRDYRPAAEAGILDPIDTGEAPSGPLDLGAALRAAFTAPPHVLHLVCARMPGPIGEPAELLAELHRLNRLHGAVVHAVAVHHRTRDPDLEDLLRRMVAQTGGTFRAIRQPTVSLR